MQRRTKMEIDLTKSLLNIHAFNDYENFYSEDFLIEEETKTE